MNINQAREQFSAYFGDALEPGMRQALDHARQTDPEIDREYREFEGMMQLLPVLLDEQIHIPQDLHDRISARIDKHVWDKAQRKSWNPLGNWRFSLYGGLAVIALVGAFLAIRQPSGSANSEAGFGPGMAAPNLVTAGFVFRDKTVHLTATVQGKGNVIVSKGLSGDVVQRIPLKNGNRLDSPLQNEEDGAVWLKVEISGNTEPMNIVVPGKTGTAKLAGEGSLADCAIALADTYRMPVQLKGKIVDSKVTWKLTEADSPESVSSSLSRTGISATVLQSGIIEISAP